MPLLEAQPPPHFDGNLLPRHPHIWRQRLRVAGAKGVDVYPATPGVAGVDRQLDGFAARPHIHKNPLHTVLMKLVVVAKAH